MSAAMLLVIAAMPVEAACPANPNRASLDIWPRDTLTSGRVVSARHPCGRTLQCIAGVKGQRGTRQCQWL
jgi:hypothetical protein